MSYEEYVDADMFAIGLERLIGDIPESVADKVGKAVAKNTRKGVKEVKANAGKGGRHAWSERYVGGFSSHIVKGMEPSGEIGNRAKPGLVHLLEKGHATINGRRTAAFPHMAPAFESIKEGFIKDVYDAVGEALQ